MMDIFTKPNAVVIVVSVILFVALLCLLLFNHVSKGKAVGISAIIVIAVAIVGHVQDTSLMYNLLAVIAFILGIAVLIYKQKIPQAKAIVLSLVVEAEKKFGNGTGDMKYAYVSGLVYSKLPSIVRFFVTQQTLDDWIEESVEHLKNYLQPDSIDASSTDRKKLEE